jgi:hypothetical protein
VFWSYRRNSGTTLSGWWLTYPSEKYDFVSWDDELPNIWKVIKIHVPNHQPVVFFKGNEASTKPP